MGGDSRNLYPKKGRWSLPGVCPPRVFSPQLSLREWRKELRCVVGGHMMLFDGSLSPKVPRPVPQLQLSRLLPSPSWERLWELSESSGGGRGGQGKTGESSGGAAPPAPPPPGPRSWPPPLCSLPASSRARRSRRLAGPRAPPSPRHPPLCLPAPGLRCRARAPSLSGAGTVAARGRVLTPTMRGELWLLVLVLREAARALSPQPGAGRTGQSWPRGPVAAAGGGGMLAEGRQAGVGMGRYPPAGDVRG